MLRTKRNPKDKTKGFTIIEAFVGISILLIGLVGPMMLVNTNLQAGRFSRDQITAYYLAQEAIEMVREVRDENFIAGNSWLAGFHANCLSASGCRADGRSSVSSSSRFQSCGSSCGTNNSVLQMNQSSGEYGHISGGTNSRFYRYIHIQQIESQQGAIVRVRVGFNTGRYVQEYETVDYLRNWSPL